MYNIEKTKKRIWKWICKWETSTITDFQKQSFFKELYDTIYKLIFIDKYNNIKLNILSINYNAEEFLSVDDIKVLELNILHANSKIILKADEKKSKIFFKSLYSDTDIDIVVIKTSS